MRVRRRRAESGWRATCAVLGAAGLWIACGTPTHAQDAYFRKTKSDANIYVAPVASSISKVAVLPFKAPTELIGSSVSDIFLTELLRAGRYTLVERGQIDRVLGETEIALSGLSESAAIEAGKMLGADGVILGTVDEYATVAHRGRSYPVVGASIRLIDCDTGRVMWSVGHARRADSPLDTLSGHARDVVHEMVSAVVQNWKVQRQVDPGFDDAAGNRDRPDELVGLAEPAAPARPETPPPAAPAVFTLSDLGLREAALQWTPPPDRSVQYRVERAESPDGPYVPIATLPASRGSYSDAGAKNDPLKDAAVYYYRLVAIGRDGQESGPTAAQESMTAPPPNPPGDLTAEAPAARAVSLAWNPPACEGIEKYLVERAHAADEVFSQVGDVSAPSFSEGGTAASPLKDSTAYLYRVRAVNRVGAIGEASAPVEITTRPPPAAPQGLAAESLQVRCVPLSWEAHPEDDVVRYDVYRADSDAGVFSFIGSASGLTNAAYLDGGRDPGDLEDDRAYFYCIRAMNAVTAESDDSEVVMATTRPRPPGVEGLAAATGLPRRVELIWNASPDEKVIGYDIERTASEAAPILIARVPGRESSAYVDSGEETSRFMRSSVKTPLQDGTRHAYRLRAVNTAKAASEWCAPVEATTKIIPETPKSLKASEGRARVIGLVWSANREKDIAEYVVETSALPDRNFTEAARVSIDETRGFKQEALPPGLTRHYRVKAIDVDGLESEWSEPVAGSTKPLPGAPTDLEVEGTRDGAFLRWAAPAQKDIARYRILNKKMFGQEEVATAETTEYFFPSEALAQKKVMFVIAVDKDGLESPASGGLEVRPNR
ncbi:MAG: hypothetical protein EOM72_01200 [Opitutae bacterium]|nr:hypothetical protein [Opitutae bacterium]